MESGSQKWTSDRTTGASEAEVAESLFRDVERLSRTLEKGESRLCNRYVPSSEHPHLGADAEASLTSQTLPSTLFLPFRPILLVGTAGSLAMKMELSLTHQYTATCLA